MTTEKEKLKKAAQALAKLVGKPKPETKGKEEREKER